MALSDYLAICARALLPLKLCEKYLCFLLNLLDAGCRRLPLPRVMRSKSINTGLEDRLKPKQTQTQKRLRMSLRYLEAGGRLAETPQRD